MWPRIIIFLKANLGGSCFLYKVGEDENRAETYRGKYLWKTLEFKSLGGMMVELH